MNNFLSQKAKIHVAGHRGLAGSAIVRQLRSRGYDNLVLRTHKELDLTDLVAVSKFYAEEEPDFVFLAAAKVGGIVANSTLPADFIVQNLRIQTSVIQAAWQHKVKRLLFLGSSCIYPRMAPQPMPEESLLTGPLEFTNRSYAIAKIAGIEMCWAFNRQHGTNFLAAMPTNLYGPGDNYDLENSHVLPALIRKVHEAKQRGDGKIVLWGSGKPLREFLYSDDMAAACVYLVNLPEERFQQIVRDPENPPIINIGSSSEIAIIDLLRLVCRVIGYEGEIELDRSRPDGTPRKLMDSSRINALGWHHSISLEEGIARSYQDLIARYETLSANAAN
jgi:GDP-L-fucose synthase